MTTTDDGKIKRNFKVQPPSQDVILNIQELKSAMKAEKDKNNEEPALKVKSEKPKRPKRKSQIVKEKVEHLRKNSLLDAEQQRSEFTIKTFNDTRPRTGTDVRYFTPRVLKKGEEMKEDHLAAVIPFFNEDSTALQQTLNSLNNSWDHLRAMSSEWYSKQMYVCLIQDGWYRASDSMKAYLKALFPFKIPYFPETNEEKESQTKEENQTEKPKEEKENQTKEIKRIYWWEHPDFNSTNGGKDITDKTYVIERLNFEDVQINPQASLSQNEGNRCFMKLTIVIKLQNKRKHNSHEWFFGENGFMDSLKPKYVFFTDAFTLFNNWCLYHLVTSMDNNKKLVAVTGRQRLMSHEQQGSSPGILSMQKLLEMYQLYDFESSNIIYNGAFSLGGMLPVIPGPCGLYLASNLRDAREYYFKTVNEDPDKTGMILGNLRIAEDRVLTYASVVKSKIEGAYMEFNQMAIFYFEAETDLETLFYQRRRWINGSVAGYIYLLFLNFAEFRAWQTNIFTKFYVWLLLMCQFLIYIMVGFSPSVILAITYHGIEYLLDYYQVSLQFDFVIFAVVLWGVYLVHIGLHHSFSKFNHLLMYCLFVLSILSATISVVSLLHYAFVYSGYSLYDIATSGNVLLYLGCYVLLGPFVASLLLSSGKAHSFFFMIKSFVGYFLLLPLMICWLGAYSYARLWDLSWGNRPSSEMDSVSVNKKKEITAKFQKYTKMIMIALFLSNLILFVLPLQVQLTMMMIFFSLAAYQLTLSLIYCLLKVFSKVKFLLTRCFRKRKVVVNSKV